MGAGSVRKLGAVSRKFGSDVRRFGVGVAKSGGGARMIGGDAPGFRLHGQESPEMGVLEMRPVGQAGRVWN